LERELSEEALKIKEVMKMIKEAGLMKTVCKLGDYYEKLVKEFLVDNLVDCDNPLSREYQKVYVRGKCVNFSPNIINDFLGADVKGAAEVEATDNQINQEITTNQVMVWPKKGKISSSKLSVKYAILNRTGAANWVPTTQSSDISTGLAKFIYAIETKTKMDFGRYVFDQTMKHAKTDVVKFPIAFPTLLCNIMLRQHPGLITADDLPMKRESSLTIHQKLFGKNHVVDLVGTSVPIHNSYYMSKEEIITSLKDTCVILDERKAQFERMIHALERKEADAGADAEDEDVEGMEEVEGDDGSGNEEEEGDNNDGASGSSFEEAE